MTKRETVWFIKPLSDQTNEQIATLLASQGISKEESEVASIIVADRPIYGVYVVDHWVIQQLERSDQHHAHVRVFRRVGNGKIEPWRFQDSSRRSLAKTSAVKAMSQALTARRPKERS